MKKILILSLAILGLSTQVYGNNDVTKSTLRQKVHSTKKITELVSVITALKQAVHGVKGNNNSDTLEKINISSGYVTGLLAAALEEPALLQSFVAGIKGPD